MQTIKITPTLSRPAPCVPGRMVPAQPGCPATPFLAVSEPHGTP